jgi:RNA-directed DNA polymerase
MESTKPFRISKQAVWDAYQRVKANHGAAGVDEESVAEFEGHLKDHLYKLWNRLSSGSYFPPPVKGVLIAKKEGGQRQLGVPMVPSYCTSIQAASGLLLVLSRPRRLVAL